MNNSYIPKTQSELENWMKENCYNFNSYSINGNAIFEGYGIDNIDGLFIWYYTERGQKNNLKYFKTESETIEYAFNQIKSDEWANKHCIGFTEIKEEKYNLENILTEMNVGFVQDEIPYYGLQRPIYRTFVFGCDINRAQHLKDKYHREK